MLPWSMDVLSSVLSTHQVRGAILSAGRYRGAFGVRIAQPDVAGFHIVTEGRCFLLMAGRAPLELLQGDIVVVPNGAVHTIADDPATPAVDLGSLGHVDSPVVPPAGPVTGLTCGAFRFMAGVPPALLAVLPPVMHLRAHEVQQDDLLRSLLRLLTMELATTGPGAAVLVDRLVDGLLIGIIRRWMRDADDGCVGWLGALRDERIGRALTALYDRPEAPWTVDSLAALAGMSRAAFAKRFQALVGEPPLAWLQSVRIDLAARHLKQGTRSVAEVAGDVGYSSEFAFSRTFKKVMGLAPSHWRLQHAPHGDMGH